MLIILNSILATVGFAGIAWYISSSSEFWPSLVYFMTLCAVGAVSVTARYNRTRSFQLLAAGLSGVSVVVLIAILIAAFVVSVGSGVAAVYFVFFPFVINVASLKWFLAEVRGYRRNPPRA